MCVRGQERWENTVGGRGELGPRSGVGGTASAGVVGCWVLVFSCGTEGLVGKDRVVVVLVVANHTGMVLFGVVHVVVGTEVVVVDGLVVVVLVGVDRLVVVSVVVALVVVAGIVGAAVVFLSESRVVDVVG